MARPKIPTPDAANPGGDGQRAAPDAAPKTPADTDKDAPENERGVEGASDAPPGDIEHPGTPGRGTGADPLLN